MPDADQTPLFELVIYDNAHYLDDSHATRLVNIPTYEQALDLAVNRVFDSLDDLWQEGMTPQALLDAYRSWGEDPAIVPEPDPATRFSAWTFAEQIAGSVCEQAAERAQRFARLAEEKRIRELPLRKVGRETRIENVQFSEHPYKTDPWAFLRSVVRCVAAFGQALVPGFAMPAYALMDDYELHWDKSYNEIMGYHDYSIDHRVAELKGANGFGLEVRLSESRGYLTSESRLEVRTLRLPEGQSIFALAELDSGSGLLAWANLDLVKHFSQVLRVSRDGKVSVR